MAYKSIFQTETSAPTSVSTGYKSIFSAPTAPTPTSAIKTPDVWTLPPGDGPQGVFANLLGGFKDIFFNHKQTIQNLKTTQTEIMPQTVQTFKDAVATLKPPTITDQITAIPKFVKDFSDSMVNITSDEINRIVDLFGKPVLGVLPAQTSGTKAEKISQGIKAATGAVGVALSPITAFFQASKNIPVLNTITNLINMPLAVAGDSATNVSNIAMDTMVDNGWMNENTKYQIQGAVNEISNLAAQLVVGGKMSFDTILKEKTPALKESFGETDAHTIIEKAREKANIEIQHNETVKTEPVASAPEEVVTNPASKKIVKTDPLIQEAQKYKSAEEFVKGKTSKDYVTVYHRTNEPLDTFGKGGIYSKENKGEFFVSNKKIGQAEGYGKNVVELRVKRSDLEINDEFPSGEEHYTLPAKKADEYLKQQSQLTDIWNKAQEVKQTTIQNKTQEEPITYQSTIGTSGLAKSVKSRAIREKIIYGFDKELRNLPDYDKRIKTEDFAKATDFVLNDLEGAHKVVFDNATPPDGMLHNDVYAALNEYAVATKDAGLIRRLATDSPLVAKSTLMGQEIQALAQIGKDSALAKMAEVKKAREAKAEKALKQKDPIIKQYTKEMSKNNLTKEDLSWDKFLNEIKC